MPAQELFQRYPREFSLAELVAKIRDMERRRQAGRREEATRNHLSARNDPAESEAEPERTE